MPSEVFIAINADALRAKSRVYIGRALKRKRARNLDEYQLWASLALELLGKSALAARHPSLVVDPNHWQSLFVAAGVKVTTDVKTITARTLFERLVHLVPRFDNAVQKFCQDIAERRNAELHSADLPFQTMKLEAWEARYWHACDTILQASDSSLEDWLGAAGARAPMRVLEQVASARKASVELRVEKAAEQFNALNKNDKRRLRDEANLRRSDEQAARFKGKHQEIWGEECPACKCTAFIGGDQISEEVSEGHDDGAIWEIVDREFISKEFICPTCELVLIGTDEIEVAGLSDIYHDQEEREMEWEPEYGND